MADREREYPERHYVALASAWRYAVVAIAATGTLAVGLTLGAVFDGVPTALAAIACAAFLLFGLLGGIGGLYDTWRYVRIIPYFQRRVGEIDTFLAGEALARRLRCLDRLAAFCGVTPLSEFGFNDDLRNEPLLWHPADHGLQSVHALLSALEEKSDVVEDRAVLVRDLQKLEHALSRAAQQGIPFCLLLRHGNATSGHEWSVRQGTAF
jgi:hypothetical protein